jgi:hypothetical protein
MGEIGGEYMSGSGFCSAGHGAGGPHNTGVRLEILNGRSPTNSPILNFPLDLERALRCRVPS